MCQKCVTVAKSRAQGPDPLRWARKTPNPRVQTMCQKASGLCQLTYRIVQILCNCRQVQGPGSRSSALGTQNAKSWAQDPGRGSKVCNCRKIERPGSRPRVRKCGKRPVACANLFRKHCPARERAERRRHIFGTVFGWIRRSPPVDSLNGLNSFLPPFELSSETLLGKNCEIQNDSIHKAQVMEIRNIHTNTNCE